MEPRLRLKERALFPTSRRNLEIREVKEPKAQKAAAPPDFQAWRWKETQDDLTFFPRLRKNLRALVVVHATWYVKAFLALLRPFIRY